MILIGIENCPSWSFTLLHETQFSTLTQFVTIFKPSAKFVPK